MTQVTCFICYSFSFSCDPIPTSTTTMTTTTIISTTSPLNTTTTTTTTTPLNTTTSTTATTINATTTSAPFNTTVATLNTTTATINTTIAPQGGRRKRGAGNDTATYESCCTHSTRRKRNIDEVVHTADSLEQLFDPAKEENRTKDLEKARNSTREIFENLDLDQSYKSLFELLWYSQLPCFDVEGVTSTKNHQYGEIKHLK